MNQQIKKPLTARQHAVAAAKQIAQAPLEILGKVPNEVLNIPEQSLSQSKSQDNPQKAEPSIEEKNKPRILDALVQEMDQIRKQKEQQEMQMKIDAERNLQNAAANESKKPTSEPIAKKGRRMVNGMKKHLKGLAARVERTPKPPSS